MSEVPDQNSAPPPSSDPIAPLRIALRGRYEFERQIGQGAFATVYLARDLKHERMVAIKVLNADPTSETGEIRFIREIRLVARLQHPNILPLHDSGHVEALLYYVMPFVDGETLRLRMHRERQMSVEAACAIARETADALAYAHKQGIVHRDIKPENILLSGGHAVVADFGIARAIDVAGVRQLTSTGVAGPGTPAYMSPEQLLGDRAVDARSDIYSLGCVLYEMLAARPPYSGKDGFVKRFTEPPPRISSLRRDTPPWIDPVIATALAKDPADRYATAADFIAALDQSVAHIRTPGRARSIRNALISPPLFDADPLEAHELGAAFPDSYPSGGGRPRASGTGGPAPPRIAVLIKDNPRTSGAIAITAVVAMVVAVWLPGVTPLSSLFGSSPVADTTRFVILPLAGDPVEGKRVAKALSDAFGGWTGIDVVSDPEVADALRGVGDQTLSLGSAADLARKLGAGRLVWGEVSGKGDSSRARVELYDVSREKHDNLRRASIASLDPEALTNAFITLFKPDDRPRPADGGDAGTRSFPAWLAYGRGHVALSRWDLAYAEREFRSAVTADRNFAAAHLWLAQTLIWRRTGPPNEWQEHATRAASNSTPLGERDRLIASSLAAMVGDDFQAACRIYTALVERDSLDFAGWYGLGECRANDSLVVADAASPTRWKFRGSYHRAALSYRKALKLEPAAYSSSMFGRIQGVLPTSSTKIRLGKGAPPGRDPFLAFPALIADTLAFIPYPAKPFAAVAPPLTRNAALERNKELLHALAVEWTRQAPQSADAYEALEDVLEARGEIDDRARGMSALHAVRRAHTLSSDPLQRLRLASREAWLRFKRGEFSVAAAMADSLLRNVRKPGPDEARLLIGLAALTGRVGTTAELARITRPFPAMPPDPIPSSVDAIAGQLFAHAALGTCSDSVASIEARLRESIRSNVAEESRRAVEVALTSRPSSMLVPCTGGASALNLTSSPDRLVQLQNAFARKNTVRVRALFDTIGASQRMQRPADISLDRTYQEAWLRRAIGDTAAAARQLDQTLGALGSIGANSLLEPGSFPAAAAAPRAMLLRAEIAAGGGDVQTARRWIQALDALWQKADPALVAQLRRVRAMAGQSIPR